MAGTSYDIAVGRAREASQFAMRHEVLLQEVVSKNVVKSEQEKGPTDKGRQGCPVMTTRDTGKGGSICEAPMEDYRGQSPHGRNSGYVGSMLPLTANEDWWEMASSEETGARLLTLISTPRISKNPPTRKQKQMEYPNQAGSGSTDEKTELGVGNNSVMFGSSLASIESKRSAIDLQRMTGAQGMLGLACQPCRGQKACPMSKHLTRGRGERMLSELQCVPSREPAQYTILKAEDRDETSTQFHPTSRALRPPSEDRMFNTKCADGPQATCLTRDWVPREIRYGLSSFEFKASLLRRVESQRREFRNTKNEPATSSKTATFHLPFRANWLVQ
ncbi:hypothetical protein F5141DRAFT_1202981 [Pisolithus sp. B1]|nr:hypothetical protein F5141DRAFT_1202981 [Pisolithus sp. B1]